MLTTMPMLFLFILLLLLLHWLGDALPLHNQRYVALLWNLFIENNWAKEFRLLLLLIRQEVRQLHHLKGLRFDHPWRDLLRLSCSDLIRLHMPLLLCLRLLLS